MRTSRSIASAAFSSILTFVFNVPATAARGPVPVSPGGTDRSSAVEARCPTFQWAGVPGARGYELAVFRVWDDGAEPVLVTRASVPGDARGFTPAASGCLERGARYAWSIAAAGEKLAWSAPHLFEVEAAPSQDELEQAIATIERYRLHGQDAQHVARGTSELDASPTSEVDATRADAIAHPLARGVHPARNASGQDAADRALPGPLTVSTTGITRVASASTTPTLGTPSLRVSANVALSADSNLFKNDIVFLWDDTAYNTAVGRYALGYLSGNAAHNTALGWNALIVTTGGEDEGQGSYNTGVGSHALSSNTIGNSNTALGAGALYSNSEGYRNTALGWNALRSNVNSGRNTAVGALALRYATGSRNTATGYRALLATTTGVDNTATGDGALRFNTTGVGNTASGERALYQNTTGNHNAAMGFRALYKNTTGARNNAMGLRALYTNTTGDDNIAIGYKALALNTDGFRNIALGREALGTNTTGDHNVALGNGALLLSTGGDRNTALGIGAGIAATTGSDNIFIGSGAQSVAGETNTIRIGGIATGSTMGTQNRTFINGIAGITTGAGATAVLIDAAGQLGTIVSSRAVKQDIADLGPLADRLLDLRPVTFRFRQHVASDPDTPPEFGLIAEEVAEVFPELVVYDAEGKPLTVRYHLLSALLLGEVQRLHERLAMIESTVENAVESERPAHNRRDHRDRRRRGR